MIPRTAIRLTRDARLGPGSGSDQHCCKAPRGGPFLTFLMGGTMGEDSEASAPARYRAFISYSHADTQFAGWLHRKLEAWVLPGQTRLTPIFIDRAELAAGPDLSAQVRAALAGSAALIVVASPAARASRWVAQEINLFRELNPDRPVLAALLQGEPIEAFPGSLLYHGGAAFEPLAADFRAGHDGKRLALLKIVAGLTAQPLDRLIQRDAQSRQRRVMAVTAGAVLLSVILAAALIVALRARTEAEHQRAEAEGMVEFMLTDLRDNLKGVGRLDILGAVNSKAMAYLSDQSSLKGLSDAELRQRAKLLHAMTEDDLATAGLAARALEEAKSGYGITQALHSRASGDYENTFAHAQSAFWLGYNYNLTNNKAGADRYWREYYDLARRLNQVNPVDPRSAQELSFSLGNLCTLELMAPINAKAALQNCEASLQASRHLVATSANRFQASLDVLNRQGWMADAYLAADLPLKAVDLRIQQKSDAFLLVRANPPDVRAQEALLRANLGLVKALKKAGKGNQAIAVGTDAIARARSLESLDPQNRDWKTWISNLQHELQSI